MLVLDDVSSIIFPNQTLALATSTIINFSSSLCCVSEVHKELVKASCTLEHCCCSRRRATQKMTNNYLEKRARVCMQQSYQYNS